MPTGNLEGLEDEHAGDGDGDLVQVLQGEDHEPDEDDDLDLTVDTARVPAISPRLVAPPNFE